mmetsp:Transcript_156310/g.291682  ORF Transcript_156310/g.291682 Transcript_156310/m.291682 type:complete len:103 (+) Transcript_156310:543-851(+)
MSRSLVADPGRDRYFDQSHSSIWNPRCSSETFSGLRGFIAVNPPIVFDMPPAVELHRARASLVCGLPMVQEMASDVSCEVCGGTGLLLSDPCPLCQDGAELA